jgi:capsular polysaccharide biosynthesis protein
MKNNLENEQSPVPRNREEPSCVAPDDRTSYRNGSSNGSSSSNGHSPLPKIDFWLVLDMLRQSWYWILLGGAVCAGVFFFLGSQVVKPKFIASGQLQRFESPGMSEFLKTAPVTAETFVSLIRSPDLFREVGVKAQPSISSEGLSKSIRIDPEPDSDMVKILLSAPDARRAVDLLNLYANEAVEYTKELQRAQFGKLANDYLKQQVEQMDKDINALDQQFRGLPEAGLVTGKLAEIGGGISALSTNLGASRPSSVVVAKQRERLEAAFGELSDLLVKYTEMHPLVQEKEALIKSLQSQVAAYSTNTSPTVGATAAAATPAVRSGGSDPNRDILSRKLLTREEGRLQLVKQLREAEWFAENPPGMVRVHAPANLATTKSNMRKLKILFLGAFGGMFGLAASMSLVLIAEFTSNRLRTTEDVKRVAGLPVLTGLGNLNQMDLADRSHWAFRTWTMLQGRLSPTANHGLVCGITSSAHGEGRSTWISLLAEAASLTGYRVLTISTRPSPMHVEISEDSPEALPYDQPEANGSQSQTSALAANILASPAQVTEQLTGPNSQPVVHIPLPGWVWNLERRREWREALNHWRSIENLVILVELPPANVPEAVLLGSNLPNVIWLSNSGTADAADTREQLETLRHARCNLVGAVVNRQGAASMKKMFPRWLE